MPSMAELPSAALKAFRADVPAPRQHAQKRHPPHHPFEAGGVNPLQPRHTYSAYPLIRPRHIKNAVKRNHLQNATARPGSPADQNSAAFLASSRSDSSIVELDNAPRLNRNHDYRKKNEAQLHPCAAQSAKIRQMQDRHEARQLECLARQSGVQARPAS